VRNPKKRMRTKSGGRRELRKLESYIGADERVDRIVTGFYGNGTRILVLTDRRLVFIKDGHMSKGTEDFALRNITSVAWQPGMVLGTVIITAAGVRAEIKNVHKGDGKELVDLVRTRLAAGPPSFSAGALVARFPA
jgi:Bacterial PH domain